MEYRTSDESEREEAVIPLRVHSDAGGMERRAAPRRADRQLGDDSRSRILETYITSGCRSQSTVGREGRSLPVEDAGTQLYTYIG